MGEIIDFESYRPRAAPKAPSMKGRLALTPAGKKRLREILKVPSKPKPPPVLTPAVEKQIRRMVDRMLRKGTIERGTDRKLRFVSTGCLAFQHFAML
jgi:hypothetical protein